MEHRYNFPPSLHTPRIQRSIDYTNSSKYSGERGIWEKMKEKGRRSRLFPLGNEVLPQILGSPLVLQLPESTGFDLPNPLPAHSH